MGELKMDIYKLTNHVFVPFLGDFFSIGIKEHDYSECKDVFVPFLGDFFSIRRLFP